VTVSSCLALRRPPRPALFPYTTLFKSIREGSRFRKREVFRQGQALAFWDGTVLGISTATDQCANRVAGFPAARFARPAVDPFDDARDLQPRNVRRGSRRRRVCAFPL